MKKFFFECVAIVAISVLLAFLVITPSAVSERDALQKEVKRLTSEVLESDTACDLRVEGLAKEIKALKAERDIALLNAESCDGVIEMARDELGPFAPDGRCLIEAIRKIVESEAQYSWEAHERGEKLECVKLDRDNLANALSDCKSERETVEAEFLRVLDENVKLEALIEAKDDALQRLGGDVNCLREELVKAQRCVRCHSRKHK